ncbi:MAG: polyphosphate kinase 1 [Alphaproteobacteria bacterium]|nr:polyphosphate kinase 1 [Alphaproteobacteria bacterium]
MTDNQAAPVVVPTHLGDPPMIDRESSWLQFNERVLEEARDGANPLLERVRFLTIFHANLDEFFMIRVSGIKQQIAAGVEVLSHQGRTPRQRLAALAVEVRRCLAEADTCLDALTDQLEGHGISIVRHPQLTDDERVHWDAQYEERVHPVLTPLAVSPAFPFPFISNLSLNLALYVTSPDGERRLVRIKIPDHLPRFVAVSGQDGGAPVRMMPIESLIKANLQSLFPGMAVDTPYTFRVTRDADVEIREDEADDLLKFVEEEVRKRRFGQAVRLEVDASAPDEMVAELKAGLHLGDEDTFRIRGIVAPAALARLCDLEFPSLKFPPFAPRLLDPHDTENLFDRIRQGDLLLHHPFDSFAPVAEFIHQAAHDPSVLAIKQTLYRTSSKSPVIGALLEAVENGKQVAAVVELKARFDEENNIHWARRLEQAGVHVIYGVPGLKTHAKLSLVVRREDDGLRRYAHIATGNYNPVTARIYTDLGLFTCDPDMTADVADLFNRITGFARPTGYRRALVAPRFMARGLLDRIRFETNEARAGRPARIIAKCNAIIERDMVEAMYEASQAGVRIELLVRGICGLVPGIPGVSENIVVRSVVGRFLEHSRVFWFHHGGTSLCYFGSADLMGRNLHRRVEVMFPIEDPALKRWLREVYLQRYLDDVGRTREMLPDGTFRRVRDVLGRSTPDVHQQFLADLGAAVPR